MSAALANEVGKSGYISQSPFVVYGGEYIMSLLHKERERERERERKREREIKRER